MSEQKSRSSSSPIRDDQEKSTTNTTDPHPTHYDFQADLRCWSGLTLREYIAVSEPSIT